MIRSMMAVSVCLALVHAASGATIVDAQSGTRGVQGTGLATSAPGSHGSSSPISPRG